MFVLYKSNVNMVMLWLLASLRTNHTIKAAKIQLLSLQKYSDYVLNNEKWEFEKD